MSRWQIPVAYRDRAQPLAHVGVDARELGDTDDAMVAREVVLTAMSEWGARTAGDLLDALEALSIDGRRRVLEAARASAGLPTVEAVEHRARIDALTSASPSPEKCPYPGCDAYPATPGGGYAFASVRRWWCDAHRDHAAPGDFEPRESRMRVTESGALVELDPGDDERASRERAQREAREQQRRLDADEFAAARRAERERDERESPDAVLRRWRA